MISILIDVSDLKRFVMNYRRAQMAGFPNAVRQLVAGMEEIRADWIDYAATTLRNHRLVQELTSLPVIHPYEGNRLAAAAIGGEEAIRVEEGTTAYDMKPGFLDGKRPVHTSGPEGPMCQCGKRHISDHPSKWVNVPFRHGQPDSTGSRFNAMPGVIYKQQSGTIPKPTASGLVAYKPGWQQGEGRRLHTEPIGINPTTRALFHRGQGPNAVALAQSERQEWQAPKLRKPNLLPQKSPEGHYFWKTGPYEDMVRIEVAVPGKKKARNVFMTWRRVSSGSDSNSWWYPAKPPRPHRNIIALRNSERLRERVRYGFAQDLGLAPMGGMP